MPHNFDEEIEILPPREFIIHGRTFTARHEPTVDQQLRFLSTMAPLDPDEDMAKGIQATQQFVLDMLTTDEQRNEMDLMFSTDLTMEELRRLFTWMSDSDSSAAEEEV